MFTQNSLFIATIMPSVEEEIRPSIGFATPVVEPEVHEEEREVGHPMPTNRKNRRESLDPEGRPSIKQILYLKRIAQADIGIRVGSHVNEEGKTVIDYDPTRCVIAHQVASDLIGRCKESQAGVREVRKYLLQQGATDVRKKASVATPKKVEAPKPVAVPKPATTPQTVNTTKPRTLTAEEKLGVVASTLATLVEVLKA